MAERMLGFARNGRDSFVHGLTGADCNIYDGAACRLPWTAGGAGCRSERNRSAGERAGREGTGRALKKMEEVQRWLLQRSPRRSSPDAPLTELCKGVITRPRPYALRLTVPDHKLLLRAFVL